MDVSSQDITAIRDRALLAAAQKKYSLLMALLEFYGDTDNPQRVVTLKVSERFQGHDYRKLRQMTAVLHQNGMLWQSPHTRAKNSMYVTTELGKRMYREMKLLTQETSPERF